MGDALTIKVVGDRELIAEFEAAITHVVPEAVALTTKGAQNVKTGWGRNLSGIRHAPRVASSISYDVAGDWRSVEAEIGAEDGPDKQGFLVPIFEYGGLRSAPRPGGRAALEVEEPKFTAAAEALLLRLLP